ncbi:MAG: Cys-tRNA(Pro) deacylase [Clostridiales bacterium]|nr:Cys-tRNA(Pro) deacylase [Clostridiales bacterium]
MTKTNAMRLLSSAKINFDVFTYEFDENDLSGIHAAQYLKIYPCEFFKTLVLKGAKNGVFVCCIPVDKELDLKKAASSFNDKSCEMIHLKDLLSIAGYMRGACTPVGMKKNYPVFFDESINNLEFVYMSAGARGLALKIKPDDIINYVNGKTVSLTK